MYPSLPGEVFFCFCGKFQISKHGQLLWISSFNEKLASNWPRGFARADLAWWLCMCRLDEGKIKICIMQFKDHSQWWGWIIDSDDGCSIAVLWMCLRIPQNTTWSGIQRRRIQTLPEEDTEDTEEDTKIQNPDPRQERNLQNLDLRQHLHSALHWIFTFRKYFSFCFRDRNVKLRNNNK